MKKTIKSGLSPITVANNVSYSLLQKALEALSDIKMEVN